MWLQHLFSFIGTVIRGFFEGIGTTILERVIDIAFASSLAVAILHKTKKDHGWRAMLTHWRQEYRTGLRFTLWCALVIYGPVLAWAIGKAAYEDHQYFVGRTGHLQRVIGENAVNFSSTQKTLEGQISDWRVKCSSLEGANGVLGSQNRDQQNTINNCQTQALKLLTPEAEKMTVITMYDVSPSAHDRLAEFVLLINKTITPVRLSVVCDKQVTQGMGSPAGGGAFIGRTDLLPPNGLQVGQVGQADPAWTPVSPLMITMHYASDAPDIKCSFTRR